MDCQVEYFFKNVYHKSTKAYFPSFRSMHSLILFTMMLQVSSSIFTVIIHTTCARLKASSAIQYMSSEVT